MNTPVWLIVRRHGTKKLEAFNKKFFPHLLKRCITCNQLEALCNLTPGLLN